MNCLVTGVSRGIGAAVAQALLLEGHEVWGISRSNPPEALSNQARFHHVPCNVADADSRQAALDRLKNAAFRPDAVILNAAVEYMEGLDRMDWRKLEHVLRTNVEGALAWVPAFMPWPDKIQFVAVSSILAHWPDADCPAYSASKAALELAFRSFRIRFRHSRVRFKLLCLGPVHTSINPRFRPDAPPPRGVALPGDVARFLVEKVLPSRGLDFYYPWKVGMVCRFGGWMPDSLFELVTRPFRR